MTRHLFSLLTLAGLLAWGASAAEAQTRAGGGGAGGGGGNVRANQGGGAGGANRAGNAGQRGNGQGGTAAQGGPDINEAAGTSASVNREFGNGFIGRGDTADRFVGNELAGTQRLNQQNPNFGQRPSSNVQGGQPTKESKVRPTLRISFETPPNAAAQTASAGGVTPRVERLSARLATNEKFAGVRLQTGENGKLLLQGTVADEQARKLAEAFLRLEPGINGIENQLTVLP